MKVKDRSMELAVDKKRESKSRITQTQRMEEVLREDEELFRQLAENIREVFWITDPTKNRMIYISPGYEEIWGRTCESLYASPRDWIEAVHPHDRQRVLDAATEKQISGDYNEVYRILRPDGSIRWIQDLAFPVRDESGKVTRIVGIAEDITEGKRVEEAVHQSEARKNAIMEAALDGILTIDLAGRIVEFNSAAEKIFECARARVIGSELAAVILPASLREWFRRGLACQFAGDVGPVLGSGVETTALRADGTEFPVEFTLTRLELDGQPMFTAFLRDISERKRSEEQIQLLADAVQSTHELISVTDHENHFTFVNRAFQKAYGYGEEEILGRKPDFLYSPNNPPGLCEQVFQETLGGGWSGEVLNCRRDGTEFPISLNTSQIKNSEGRILGLVGVARDISERKRAESVLRESEEKFRTLFESAPLAMALHGADGKYVQTNRAYQEMLGYSEDQLLKSGVKKVTHPADIAEGQRLFGELRAGKRDHYLRENRYLHKDGRLVWAQSSASAIRNGSGELNYVISMVEDITRRKEALEALGQSERRLRLIAENTTDVIFAFDMNRRPVYVNAAVKELTGYGFAEIQEKGFINWIHPEDEERMLKLWEELFAGTGHSDAEFRLITKSGQMKWCSSAWGPLLDESGHQIGVQGRERDITELKRADATTQEMAAIVENSEDAIISETLEGKIVSWNRAAERIYGYTAAEVIGRHVSMLAPEDRSQEVTEMRRGLARGEKVEGFETLRRRKNGALVEVSLTISPVKDFAGRVIGVSTIARDITERRRLEKELLEISANERRRIGHELHDGLGQYLAGIAVKVKLLEETLTAESVPHPSGLYAAGAGSAPEARAIVQLIGNAIRQTRNLAKGFDPIEVEAKGLPTALRQLARETENIFKITCSFSCSRTVPPLREVIGFQLYRIAQEAINNALKHGRPKAIHLKLLIDSGQLSLSINDDGTGFTYNPPHENGMGLRIMKYRAESIGGVLKIDSQAESGTEIKCKVRYNGHSSK